MPFVNEIWNKSRRYLKLVVLQRSTPDNIALSFAIGTFIAIIPMFGAGILLGLAIAFMFRKLNKIALMSAFVVWNPLFTVPLIALSGNIGNLLFDGMEVVKYELEFFNNFFTFTRRFLVGNLIIDAIFTLISYFAIKHLFIWYQKRREMRKLKAACKKEAFAVVPKE